MQEVEREVVWTDVASRVPLLEQAQLREHAKERRAVEELFETLPAVCPPRWLVLLEQLQPLAIRAQPFLADLATCPRELV